MVKETNYYGKISDIKGKYFTTADYNKFASDIPDEKIKQRELISKSNVIIL